MKLQEVKNKRFLSFINLWTYIFMVTIFSYPVLTSSENAISALTSENPNCKKAFSSKGYYTLEFKEECELYSIHLDSEKDTSIINLTISIEYVADGAETIDDEKNSEASFTTKVYETTTYSEIPEENVLMEEWTEKVDRNSTDKNYLSRSPKVFVKVSGTGNILFYNFTLMFHEIDYRISSTSVTLSESDVESAWVTYRPNSVFLLRLKGSKTSPKGIEMTFDNVSIDTEMGEYILVGTGTEPLQDKGSRPLFVTQIPENATFYIDNPTAYVAFVSGSTKKEDEGFNITWRNINAEIEDVTEDPLGRFNSSLICFYNATAAEEEFKKDKSLRFETFRESFAIFSKKYLKCLHDEYKNIELRKESIDLFGKPKAVNSSVLSILLKVMYQGKSIFTWRKLQEIIEDFEKNSSNDTHEFKVGRCPHNRDIELFYKSDEWEFAIYAMVPIFALFGLMMWAWKQNVFAENCMPEKEEKVSFDQIPVEPNPYVTRTIPKICRYDEEGRRETLIPGSPQQENSSATEDTAMVEMDVIPSTSKQSDTLTRFLTSRKSKSRPSIQSLIETTEEINKMPHPSKAEGNESDHLYDSVGSSKDLNETKL